MSSAWERARQGRVCALVGESLGAPPTHLESVVIRVLCRRGTSTLAPILEAREKVEKLLDASRPLLDLAADRVRVELRRHLLGEADEITRDAGLCESLQRLSRRSPRPCILVFDAVDQADPATLEALEEVVRRARIGLILAFRELPTDSTARSLLELVQAIGGQGAVREAFGEAQTSSSAAPGVSTAPESREKGAPSERASDLQASGREESAPVEAEFLPFSDGVDAQDDRSDGMNRPSSWTQNVPEGMEAFRSGPAVEGKYLDEAPGADSTSADPALPARAYALPELPRAVVQVLRAGALIGAGFEAALVADLLELSELSVLEHLQHAFDSGVPIEDQGDGRFVFDPEVHEALRAQILPSLAAAWHRKLARLLTEERMAPPELRVAAPLLAGAGDARLKSGTFSHASPSEVVEISAESAVQASTNASSAAEAEGSSLPGSPDQPIFGGAAAITRVPEPPLQADADPSIRYRHIDDTPSGVVLPFSPQGEFDEETEDTSAPDEAWMGTAQAPSETSSSASAAVSERPADPPTAPALERSDALPALDASALDASALDASSRDASSRDASSRDGASQVTGGLESLRAERPDPRKPLPEAPRLGSVSDSGVKGAARPLLSGSPDGRRDPARAAAHLLAVGELDGAAERLLAASEQAERLGAFSQAVSFARQAVSVLERLPSNVARRQLLIRCWLALGRLTRDLQGRGPDFTLALALRILEGAQQLLHSDDPVPLQAELLAAMAGVYYDLGDRKSLDQALDALTQASRLLQSAGDATGAARLLNDQAAVWVRLGDPVRAWYLLGESRKVFESRAETDPVAMEELAETDHLLARLTFHVPARPGKEAEAVEVGLNHARAAEGAYKRLKSHRALARVWETQGRLHLMGGRIPQAQEKLQRAMEYQEKLGDLLGLARTVGVMAELLASSGELDQALSLLRESIVMNVEQGSSQGLETTQQAFETLLSRLRPLDRERAAEALQVTQQQLARASRWIARRS